MYLIGAARMSSSKLVHFRFGIIQATKGDRICRACLSTGSCEFTIANISSFRLRFIFCLMDALNTKCAFFHHAFRPRPVRQITQIRIEFRFVDLRLGEIESPRPVRTRGLAVPTANAPIVVDHDDAVVHGGAAAGELETGRGTV